MTDEKTPADANHKPKPSHNNPSPPVDDPRDDLRDRMEIHRSQLLSFRTAYVAQFMRKNMQRH